MVSEDPDTSARQGHLRRLSAEAERSEPALNGRALAESVFKGFPYGILVLDRTGQVVGANPAAREILGDALDAPAVRCCDLIGCRDEAGPLAGSCISELARSSPEALPEVRVELATDSPESSCWVTASRLEPAGGHLVLELRPAPSQDRRRRTEPHWMAGPRLTIKVLGNTEVASTEADLGGTWLEQRPGQLLKYLISERERIVRVDEIAEAIWPGSDPRVVSNVRHYIHALRERLEPARPKRAESSFIDATGGGYRLRRERIELDADLFEENIRAGLRGIQRGEGDAPREYLERAMELYQGDFLADTPFADWAFAERERLRDLASRALRALCDLALARGELGEARLHTERLAELHPFDLDVHRELIELCLQQGRKSEAVRRYSALRVRLRKQFDEEPDFDLSDLSSQAAEPRAGRSDLAAGGGRQHN